MPPSARAFHPASPSHRSKLPGSIPPDQDDAARVGARLVAVQRQPVRSVDVVKPSQAFRADLAGDLATVDRSRQTAVSH